MVKEQLAILPENAEYENERNKPLPSLNHSLVQTRIILGLSQYQNIYNIASELSLQLDDWVSVPDISLLPKAPIDTQHNQIRVKEPPLCVIEILSPTQSLSDLTAKVSTYFEQGVKSCWLVLPGLDNIYVFEAPHQYEMYKKGETLKDKKLEITINVSPIFE
ncbi:MAG TPA: Uma2 family endonuclease [Saprospiraceae bacterium]|nr:Uma2 family endonuclease [Saprospiraceae bacterium]HMQ85134.1 Uma2 family endonuclease [Saprospiraceae bacterium]